MHVQEAVKPTLLALLNLQLTQQTHKPLKGLLVAVDPEEIDLQCDRVSINNEKLLVKIKTIAVAF